MAIPEDVKPFLEGFTAEELKTFDGFLTKAPKLAEGWLRQSDYDRKMNTNKAEVETAKTRAKELEDWYAENKPIHDRSLQRTRELEDSQRDLETKLKAAETRRAAEGGDQVDAAELKARVTEEVNRLREQYGWVSKADQEKIINDEAKKLALEESKKFVDEASKRFYEETLPQSVNFAADVAEICVDHKGEFSEYLDRKKFAEFMSERKILDPKKGYEEFVKPKRDEKEFKRKVDEEVKQRISGLAISGNNIAPGGGIMPKGVLQMRIEKDAQANGQTSTTALAAQAAQELRAEGKM